VKLAAFSHDAAGQGPILQSPIMRYEVCKPRPRSIPEGQSDYTRSRFPRRLHDHASPKEILEGQNTAAVYAEFTKMLSDGNRRGPYCSPDTLGGNGGSAMPYVLVSDGAPDADDYASNYIWYEENNSASLERALNKARTLRAVQAPVHLASGSEPRARGVAEVPKSRG